MAYGEYRSSGKCPGTCLYQLSCIGLPLHVVESVVFDGDSHIHYRGELFATYSWTVDASGRTIPYFNFAPAYAVYIELQDRWRRRYNPIQEFVIIDHVGRPVDACTQFFYKGYQISMSTVGRSAGASPSPVAVFSDATHDGYFESMVCEFHTVEDAIKYIDGDAVVPIRLLRPIIQTIEFITE